MFEKVCIQKQHNFKAFLYGHLFIIIMQHSPYQMTRGDL